MSAACLKLELTGSELVFVNECDREVALLEVEVKYHVTGLPVVAPAGRPARVRRLVTERLKPGVSIPPRGSFTLYFGAVSNVVEVHAVVETGSGPRRVKLYG